MKTYTKLAPVDSVQVRAFKRKLRTLSLELLRIIQQYPGGFTDPDQVGSHIYMRSHSNRSLKNALVVLGAHSLINPAIGELIMEAHKQHRNQIREGI